MDSVPGKTRASVVAVCQINEGMGPKWRYHAGHLIDTRGGGLVGGVGHSPLAMKWGQFSSSGAEREDNGQDDGRNSESNHTTTLRPKDKN